MLVFQDPPPMREQSMPWAEIKQELRSRPKEWALIGEGVKVSIANALRDGKITSMRTNRGVEVRTANNTRDIPRTCDVYARYIPSKDQYPDD